MPVTVSRPGVRNVPDPGSVSIGFIVQCIIAAL